jgi:K+-transporting ATPase ATPase A chain
VLAFNLAGVLLLFLILRTQLLHPWNPADLPPQSTFLAFNTAVSFMTNTWPAPQSDTSS